MNPPRAQRVLVRDHRTFSKPSFGRFSMRERSLLAMLLPDSSDGEIAAALLITEATVRLAIRRLVRRLGVQSRQDLIRLLFESGIDSLEQRLLERATNGSYSPGSSMKGEKAPEFDTFWMFGESAESV